MYRHVYMERHKEINICDFARPYCFLLLASSILPLTSWGRASCGLPPTLTLDHAPAPRTPFWRVIPPSPGLSLYWEVIPPPFGRVPRIGCKMESFVVPKGLFTIGAGSLPTDTGFASIPESIQNAKSRPPRKRGPDRLRWRTPQPKRLVL